MTARGNQGGENFKGLENTKPSPKEELLSKLERRTKKDMKALSAELAEEGKAVVPEAPNEPGPEKTLINPEDPQQKSLIMNRLNEIKKEAVAKGFFK